jgi:hypothetical protein
MKMTGQAMPMKSAAEEKQQSNPEAHDKYSNDNNPPLKAI